MALRAVFFMASTACWCQIRCRIWHPPAASAGMLPATLLGSAQTPDGLRAETFRYELLVPVRQSRFASWDADPDSRGCNTDIF